MKLQLIMMYWYALQHLIQKGLLKIKHRLKVVIKDYLNEQMSFLITYLEVRKQKFRLKQALPEIARRYACYLDLEVFQELEDEQVAQ